ncbi:hypothetical protein Dimus_010755 [Dionaea muscipula]
MDEFPGRRTAGKLLVSRKCSSIVLRDSTDNKGRNPRICSRIGCSSKLNSMKGPQIGSVEKAKSSRHSFRPCQTGKKIIGSSSTTSDVNGAKIRFSHSKKKLSSESEMTGSETCSNLDESETSESIGKTRVRDSPEPLSEAASSRAVSQGRHGKKNMQRFVLGNQDSTSGSSISKHAGQGTKNSSSVNRYNFRGFKCNSLSDVVQSGCSSSEPSLGRKSHMGRKRTSETESSLSARGKKISSPSFIDDRRNAIPNHGIAIMDSRSSVLGLGREKDAISVRTRTSAARTRLSKQGNRNRSQLTELSPSLTALSPQSGLVFDANGLSAVNQSSTQASSTRYNYSSHSGSGNENMGSNRSTVSFEVGVARSLMNRDGLRQYNLEGIAEVLLSLDRIEQDEELSYEHLFALETNLFLGGLPFHDQHRDMRLDIDNLSYEELLALEERMGSVSTALTEDELQKCLKENIYQTACSELGTIGCEGSGDDIKCSICQEEYVTGEEVGKLGCGHMHHIGCIQSWLRLKNWCPICKAAAVATASPALA